METPRQRRHKKTGKNILAIARKLVVKKGHENISLRELARQADFSPSGLYEYFPSKQELFAAIADSEAQKMVEALEEISSALPFEENLVELCLFYVDHAVSNPNIFNLMNSFSGKRRNLKTPVPENSPYKVILDVVQELIDAKEIGLQNGFGAEEMTYSLWALVHGMADLQLGRLKGFDADFKSVDRRAVEVFIEGMLSK
jgi:AcrR family transcriptional regulator